MNRAELFEGVVKILGAHAENKSALAAVTERTHVLDDLKVNSARLVDVVLLFEDTWGIEIADEDIDGIATVGDCVDLIGAKLGG